MKNYKIWNFEEFKNNTIAITDDKKIYSYNDLLSYHAEFKKTLDDRCLIFNFCNNSFGALIGYTYFMNNNIVQALLNKDLDLKMTLDLIELYNPSYLWVPNSIISNFDFEVVLTMCEFSLLKTNLEVDYKIYDELALLLTTSGSTGSPKFVRQSYCNIQSNTNSIVQYLEIDSSERPITTLPMNYTYGLSIINSHLAVGATILLTDKKFMEKSFWEFLNENKATSMGGVPYTYEMLDKLRFFRKDTTTIKTMTQAGGKITKELHQKIATFAYENNKKFVVMYGQTEATARMGYLPYDMALDKIGSMGIAIPNGRFSIIDVDGNDINEPNVTGELVYFGENVTLGYANNKNDLILGDENNGKLVTGDMAIFDEDGYYYIVGRKKRFLKLFGNRVNLDETERLLKNKFQTEICCSGVDDKMYIFLVVDNLDNEIIDFISDKLSINRSAFTVRVIDEIEKNDAGKILYTNLVKYFED